MRIRSRSTGKPWHNLRAKLDQRFGRRFDFQTAASAAEDNPIESDHPVIDIQRHSLRKGERRSACKLRLAKTCWVAMFHSKTVIVAVLASCVAVTRREPSGLNVRSTTS